VLLPLVALQQQQEEEEEEEEEAEKMQWMVPAAVLLC
jgi:hypothetical protein